ncbi:hypothetical protein PABG_12297 [Paracoccidioides brasiliensis Pb03]|uniref:FAR-17a/AIG1-like protein n=2 Tax=Paracoccidioides brasiliensis TaxID=121759 RepID=C1GKF2_PARBD|nr:uncharacterized protein PADG_07738 [Paracoccidioides brasiliensis Pb18]EEH42918.1 hypothetical protein PADG_07738 [Paracoccidioides brasiliensis Pb18]KGY14803.1 hypothetical protein PABG_12297 [Paracoccidioides brasiliensis Pb03]ODH38414.1 hypothetical protein ACO22_02365 [Paracoccidioides brasiliensis]ODH53657.1 hypothetical protein GX48_00075 [Paracoccidioides brasiliensis]
MRSMRSLMGVDPAHDKFHHFETSWVFTPITLAVCRAIIYVYCFVTILVVYGWQGTHGLNRLNVRSFSYFTNMSFVGVAVYFLVAAVHAYLYGWKGRSVLFDKWPRWLRALHSLFYTTVVVYPFLVMVVFWSFLYEGRWFPLTFQAWANVTQHILTPCFSLFEIICSTAPPPPLLHLVFLILLLVLYLGVAYLTRATQGFFVYPFLNPDSSGRGSGRVTGYVFGVAGILVLLFGFVWVLSYLRMRFLSKNRTKWSKADTEAWAAVHEGNTVDGPEMGAAETRLDEAK